MGSKAERRGAYGGKFALLSEERQRAYEKNKQRRAVKADNRAG